MLAEMRKLSEELSATASSTEEIEDGNRTSQTSSAKHAGMSLWVASIFIVGEMAGSGVLALPQALGGTGWIGLLMIFLCCANAGYSGIHLGKCWLILEERWEEYRGKVRNPYPTIGERVGGKWVRRVVSVCVNLTLFGASTVYLLLCSQLVGNLIRTGGGFTVCHWVLVLGTVLCPLTWLGTPAEFWPAAVGALATTALACILLVAKIPSSIGDPVNYPTYPSPTFSSFFLSFGTIIFAFGGASTFPTFQNDMNDKKQFPKAAIFAFIGLLILYVPVAITGYSVYGFQSKSNVVLYLQDGWIKQTIEVFLASHFFFAFIIVFNPMAQEMEEIFKVPASKHNPPTLIKIVSPLEEIYDNRSSQKV